MHHRRTAQLETISLDVPESALEIYESALSTACATVGFFRDQTTGDWRVEGIKQAGSNEPELATALALAAKVSGVSVPVRRTPTPTEGWLARTYASLPEQMIGRRFAVRGTHLHGHATPGRITLTLDAGLRVGRTWLDARMSARAGAHCLPAAASHSGSGNRVWDPGHGCRATAASSRIRH